jgi:hypothetical protein
LEQTHRIVQQVGNQLTRRGEQPLRLKMSPKLLKIGISKPHQSSKNHGALFLHDFTRLRTTYSILKYMYEIFMTATSNRAYYHKVQDYSLPISNPA